ncbi:MAG: aldehyde ferredoxin oxidoreductase family protein [Halanaerobiales bacterium]|nr:aldehyde ferredoxin oxidoreductase family protein [Halanaerobiales bacterium]
MNYGYCGKALRINLTKNTTDFEVLSPKFLKNYLGGRGLNIRKLYDEVPPNVDPLSEKNKMFIGVGPLTGTLFPGSARVNFTAKSPQTNILGDSNTGGFFGPEIKFAGYDQIVIEGKAKSLSYIYIKDEKVEVLSAKHLKGLDVFETQKRIIDDLDDNRIQVACIGPAAENGVKYSGIFCNKVRAAARTGMGLVLASKNIKAIAVRGTKDLKASKPAKFKKLIDKLDQEIINHSEYDIRVRLGTTKLVSALNKLGCLATKHFQTGYFKDADKVSGEYLEKHYKKKEKACFSCTIPCSRFFEITKGKHKGLKSEGPEFEGLAGFSSRVGISNIEDALKGVDLCNRFGLDVITTSECISFTMELFEKGILKSKDIDGLKPNWGNSKAVLKLIEKIKNREGFGDILADGVAAAAKKIGKNTKKLAMHVKGLEIFQADPRGIKGYGLGVAVATRGGDHLRSEPWFEFKEDPKEGKRRFGHPEAAFRLKYKGKGKVVKYYEERCVLADSLEVCKNTLVNMEIISYKDAAELLNSLTKFLFTEQEIKKASERIMNLERAYIVREGIRRKDDTLPERFLKEPLPKECGPSAGSVVEIEPMLDEYYLARNWNIKTGIPTVEKLKELSLHEIAKEFIDKKYY